MHVSKCKSDQIKFKKELRKCINHWDYWNKGPDRISKKHKQAISEEREKIGFHIGENIWLHL
jgi:hypothetical protein